MNIEFNNYNNSIIVSSKIKVLRNIKNIPFNSKLNIEQISTLNGQIVDAISENEPEIFSEFRVVNLDDCDETDINLFIKKEIISPEYAQNITGKIILLSEDENISVLLGGSDHICIQVCGLNVDMEYGYELLDRIDNAISDNLPIAFDEQFGYLTANPDDVGTAMYVSAVLHLPKLKSEDMITDIAETVSHIGMEIISVDYDNSLFRITNKITLGITESAALQNLRSIVLQLAEKEKNL